MELSFVIGNRGWLGLWKPTIDALDPILGRTYPDNPYHPLDGRITELGMHLTVDRALGYDVLIGITAAPAVYRAAPARSDPTDPSPSRK
ncbi:hypothetical protein MCHUDSM44219_05709 [Mycolicibacterium chubuense]|uniref:Uncharacterized protein n=2 Tax=Mycolicibacterium chubuense TaxID=1800 RepID=A0A0J6V7M3_MYCCU|nr:hypothetical protein MCHUDSM44219_05709 [Mycolicibacterium chubuense]SPX95933.1 Uncharacterised protein [Mycolicibacterium chubuense]